MSSIEQNIVLTMKEIIPIKFHCGHCNYTATDKSNFNKHIKTKKHQKAVITPEEQVVDDFICQHCDKICKTQQALSNHIKTCNNKTTSQQSIIPPELITLLAQQTEMIAKLSERIEQQSQPQIINNIVYDNSLNQTNQVNIHFNVDKYINETCINAKNFEDTLPSIIHEDIILSFDKQKLTNRELFSKMLNGFWANIPQTLRPIQATDLRRNKYYFKTNNQWLKSGTPENDETIMNSIGKLFHLGMRSIQAITTKNNENKEIQKLQAISSVVIWDELYIDALPQILSKNQIEKEQQKK